MDAVQGELIGIVQKPLATGPAGRSVENAVGVSKPVDFPREMIRGQDGETGIADFSITSLAKASDCALV